ncbi:8212_t:CDS:1 [Racocetra persica]|uniref:8212_t:CDS:1 n=1 Tax=Racocetra persica TaxID=160502 RepID=A0ACA9PV23_9GLOM|nr:8212_t:CDS:1 [Racocetra persica]
MLLLNNLKIQETISKSPHSSSFILRYLPSTWGITLGNSLRRVLLSALSGVAAFAIEIKVKKNPGTTDDEMVPVLTKISSLAGVTETTPYLILNCKEVVVEVKKKDETYYCLEMDANSPKDEEYIVTAKDFKSNPHLEIKNPDLYLATLAPSSRLQIKLYFREDYDYHAAENQEKYLPEAENVIFLNTNFSPIKVKDDDISGVNFQVNPVVTGLEAGEAKEEEELKLTITTTGAISPRQALRQALEITNQINDQIKSELVK